MEKINKGDELTQSMDLVQENILKLKELFPEVFAEDKIDFKVLRDVLGDEVEEEEEYYRFTWAGKAQARREAHKPSTGTLRPCQEESVDWNTTQNLYIEGDNLEVLKLLQKSYANKVKMIYIDPPYNTGKDFVYKDNYKDNLKNYQELTGQIDDDGNKLFTNSDSDGRYHSNWLNMMYPRLSLARNLLKDDGVIFISIDDNEVDNLKKICDEIFGEKNFVANAIWRSTDNSNNDAKQFSSDHNYTLIYSKKTGWLPIKIFDKSKQSHFKNPDNDPKGAYFDGNPLNSPSPRKNLTFDIVSPQGHIISPPKNGWRWSKDTIQDKISTGEIRFTVDGKSIRRRTYLSDAKGLPPSTLWIDLEKTGHNRQAKYDLLKIIPEDVFDTPKPVKLIKYIIELLGNDSSNEIILDFFSGSATTAHAVIQFNVENTNKKRFIQVQIPEGTDEKSEAFKAGFKTISEIGKERIRRAGDRISNQYPEMVIDRGFKVFKLDTSNIETWDGNPDDIESNLFDSQDNIKTERTEEDVLFEILLKYGLDLTLPIEEKEIEGKKVFNVGFGALFICLANDVTSKVAEGIGQWKKELNPETCRVIFKDGGFTDVEKTNSVQTLKRFGIHEIKSI